MLIRLDSLNDRHRSSLKVKLNPPDDIVGRDHVEAAGDAQFGCNLNRLFADVPLIFLVAITYQLTARSPTASVQATGERSDGRDVLVVGVCLPVCRFSAASDNHTGTLSRTTGPSLDGGRQVHGKCNRTDDSIGMMHEADKLPGGRFPD